MFIICTTVFNKHVNPRHANFEELFLAKIKVIKLTPFEGKKHGKFGPKIQSTRLKKKKTTKRTKKAAFFSHPETQICDGHECQ